MRFDVYKRFTLEIIREDGRWRAFRVGEGKRRPERDLIIPGELPVSEMAGFLDDHYHEYAMPGGRIEALRDRE